MPHPSRRPRAARSGGEVALVREGSRSPGASGPPFERAWARGDKLRLAAKAGWPPRQLARSRRSEPGRPRRRVPFMERTPPRRGPGRLSAREQPFSEQVMWDTPFPLLAKTPSQRTAGRSPCPESKGNPGVPKWPQGREQQVADTVKRRAFNSIPPPPAATCPSLKAPRGPLVRGGQPLGCRPRAVLPGVAAKTGTRPRGGRAAVFAGRRGRPLGGDSEASRTSRGRDARWET